MGAESNDKISNVERFKVPSENTFLVLKLECLTECTLDPTIYKESEVETKEIILLT